MTSFEQQNLPFQLNIAFHGPMRQRLFDMVKPALERALQFPALNDIYLSSARLSDDRQFVDKILSVMRASYDISEADLASIPRTGPVVVVANHPFGGIEGIILGAILRSVRPDAKMMATYYLERILELHDLIYFVDPFGGADAVKRNLGALRHSLAHLKTGGMLGLFPSGEVSHLDMSHGTIADPPWLHTAARLVRKTQASVLPIFFDGANGALFQLAGLVHPRLRTALLGHEIVNKKGLRISVRVGSVIPFSRLKDFTDDAAMTDYLRLRTYILKNRQNDNDDDKRGGNRTSVSPKTPGPEQQTIVDPVDPKLLAADLAFLPPDALMDENRDLAVYVARAEQMPNILREIGRLREISFRLVSEGTGKSIDLDHFDDHYLHLFVFNRAKSEVVGAYRMGLTDEILPRLGIHGLYTHTLFNFDGRLLEQINPAIELGRSWVRLEYQKSYAALLLAWKGIGKFVVRHPRYRQIFGPVSINSQYRSLSQQLIMFFMGANNLLPSLAQYIHPRNPPRIKPISYELRNCSAVVRDMDEVSSLVSEIESDQKGIPVLLRQYLKMGAKLLAFNIDPSFGDVLDGLMIADLTQTDQRILEKYMGKAGVESFMAHHAAPSSIHPTVAVPA